MCFTVLQVQCSCFEIVTFCNNLSHRRDKKEFLTGSTIQPLIVSGSQSLEEFTRLQKQQKHLQDLRQAGLTDGDIVLKLGVEEARRLFDEADPLRPGGMQVGKGTLAPNPDVNKERICAIEKVGETHQLKFRSSICFHWITCG